MSAEREITVLGVDMTGERFPNLYPMAENNPDRLAKQLASLAKATGNDDFQSVAATYEHDLEHERLVNLPSPTNTERRKRKTH